MTRHLLILVRYDGDKVPLAWTDTAAVSSMDVDDMNAEQLGQAAMVLRRGMDRMTVVPPAYGRVTCVPADRPAPPWGRLAFMLVSAVVGGALGALLVKAVS
jgi:hypothetical protein